MPLSPEQIVAEEFRLRARGYDRDEVDAYLDRLADQVEADAARLRNAEQRTSALEAELTAVREREATLTRTLATVQDAADRARADAEAEVAALRTATERELAETRAQALQEAEGIRSEAEHEAAALRARLREAQDLDATHRELLRGHLQGQLEALEALPDPYAALIDRASSPAVPAPADVPPAVPSMADVSPADVPPAVPSMADVSPADVPPAVPSMADVSPADVPPAAVPPADLSRADAPAADAPAADPSPEPSPQPSAPDAEDPSGAEDPADPWQHRPGGDGDAESEDQPDRPVEPDPPMWS